MKTIRQKAQDMIDAFAKDVEIVPGLFRNTKSTIERIYAYKHDRFVECTDESAIFWQMVTPYIDHKAKLLDVDPKDFKPEGQGEYNQMAAWILRKRYLKWVEDENFAVEVDDTTKEVSAIGSVIEKIVNGKWEMCDLRRVAFDPKLKTIKNKPFVEIHDEYSVDDIREMADVWDNTDKLIDKCKDRADNPTIYEVYCYDENKFVKAVYSDLLDEGEYLEYEEVKTTPYRDIHIGKFEGMWLRRGMYEMCFPEQERANTLVNQNAEATAIASLLLLRSTDTNTNANVLRQAVSGQIINSSDLQQIGIDNRAFTTLLNELTTIQAQVQRKLKMPDIATGDTLPSGTAFRSMALMTNAYKSAFKQERTRVAQGIVDILLEDILPGLVKGWNKGDILEIAEDDKDAEAYDKAIEELMMLEYYKQANADGREVMPEEEEMFKQQIRQQINAKGRRIQIEKGLFDFKYGLKIDPTGETYDKAQQNDAIIQALTLKMQNPAITDEPEYKQLLENNGIPPHKMTAEQKQALMQGMQPVQMPTPQANNPVDAAL